eukprot:284818849_6
MSRIYDKYSRLAKADENDYRRAGDARMHLMKLQTSKSLFPSLLSFHDRNSFLFYGSANYQRRDCRCRTRQSPLASETNPPPWQGRTFLRLSYVPLSWGCLAWLGAGVGRLYIPAKASSQQEVVAIRANSIHLRASSPAIRRCDCRLSLLINLGRLPRKHLVLGNLWEGLAHASRWMLLPILPPRPPVPNSSPAAALVEAVDKSLAGQRVRVGDKSQSQKGETRGCRGSRLQKMKNLWLQDPKRQKQ